MARRTDGGTRSTPYSRPNGRRDSFLSKVKDSVVDILTPSWLSAIVSSMSKDIPKVDCAAPSSSRMSCSEATTGPVGTTTSASLAPAPLAEPSKLTLHSLNSVQLSTTNGQMHRTLPNTVSAKPTLPPADHRTRTNTMDWSHMNKVSTSSYSQQIMSNDGASFSQPSRSDVRTTAPDVAVKRAGLPVASLQHQGSHSQLDTDRVSNAEPKHTTQDSDISIPQGSYISVISKRPEIHTSTARPDESIGSISLIAASFASSSSCVNGSTLGSRDVCNSSFYPGKTVYGGAANNKVPTFPMTSPYSRTVVKPDNISLNQQHNKPARVSSKAAKLILNAMHKVDSTNDELGSNAFDSSLYSSSIYLRRRDVQGSSDAPPTVKIVPKSTAIITSNVFVPPATVHATPSLVDGTGTAAGGKMKRERTVHYSAKSSNDQQEVVTHLPTTFTLPLTSTPKINIGVPNLPKMPNVAELSSATKDTFIFRDPIPAENLSNRSLKVLEKKQFEFRAPLDVSAVQKIKLFSSGIPTMKKQEQSSVLTGIGKASNGHGNTNQSLSLQTESFTNRSPVENAAETTSAWGELLKRQNDKWTCAACLVANDNISHECVACNSKRAVGHAHKSLTAAKSINNTWGDLVQKNNNKWVCNVCLVANDAENPKCAACGSECTGNAQDKDKIAVPIKEKDSWGDLIKNQNSKWTCGACLLANDSARQDCVACGNRCSETVSSSKMAPSEGWTCDSCLIQNEAALSVCCACGSKKDPKDGTVLNQHPPNWGTLITSTADVWTCSTCFIKNKSDLSQCAACGCSKLGNKSDVDITGTVTAGWQNKSTVTGWGSLVKKDSSLWTCGTCLVSNPCSVSLCKACNACKPGTQSSLGDLRQGKQLPLFGVMFGSMDSASTSSTEKLPMSPTFSSASASTASTGFPIPAGGFKFGGFPVSSIDGIKSSMSDHSLPFPLVSPSRSQGIQPAVPTSNNVPQSMGEALSGTNAPVFGAKPFDENTVFSAITSSQPLPITSEGTIAKTALFQFGSVTSGSDVVNGSYSGVKPGIFPLGGVNPGAKPSVTTTFEESKQATHQFHPAIDTKQTASDMKPSLFQFSAQPSSGSLNQPALSKATTALTPVALHFGMLGSSTSTKPSDIKPIFSFGVPTSTSESVGIASKSIEPQNNSSFGASGNSAEFKPALHNPSFIFGSQAASVPASVNNSTSGMPFQFQGPMNASSIRTLQSSAYPSFKHPLSSSTSESSSGIQNKKRAGSPFKGLLSKTQADSVTSSPDSQLCPANQSPAVNSIFSAALGGLTQPSIPSVGFQFGLNATNLCPTSTSNPFQFGSTINAPQTTTQSATFGTVQSTPFGAANTPVFAFSAGNQENTVAPAFTVGSSQNRVTKKATRRLKK